VLVHRLCGLVRTGSGEARSPRATRRTIGRPAGLSCRGTQVSGYRARSRRGRLGRRDLDDLGPTSGINSAGRRGWMARRSGMRTASRGLKFPGRDRARLASCTRVSTHAGVSPFEYSPGRSLDLNLMTFNKEINRCFDSMLKSC